MRLERVNVEHDEALPALADHEWILLHVEARNSPNIEAATIRAERVLNVPDFSTCSVHEEVARHIVVCCQKQVWSDFLYLQSLAA